MRTNQNQAADEGTQMRTLRIDRVAGRVRTGICYATEVKHGPAATLNKPEEVAAAQVSVDEPHLMKDTQPFSDIGNYLHIRSCLQHLTLIAEGT